MDYEKKYKDALARMELCVRIGFKITPEYIFPELAESEDERIRKWIASYIHHGVFTEDEHPMALKAVEWLEKQKVIAAIPDELVECYKNLCERGNRGVASLIDAINGFYGRKFAPKFRVGDVMRAKQEAAHEYERGYYDDCYAAKIASYHGFIAGSDWKEQQMLEDGIDCEVKIDAGGYPYIERAIELYDYEKDEPLAKKGDKYKLVLLKVTEDEAGRI